MADDKNNNDDDKSNNDDDFGALTGGDDDGGFGNLPPLSDFDSAEGDSDGGLPPMDSDPGDSASVGGLPPIVDIKVDTPAVRPSDLDTPDTGSPQIDAPGGGFDTPTNDLDTPDPAAGLGFQDFAADSDFSPETPEIGPGPDSDIETPMFDSAFGGTSDDFSSGGAGTSDPTQAMETPMFDTGGDSGMGFDNDAFSAPTPDVGMGGGTPVPDFSPDTGMPQEIGQVAAVPGVTKRAGGIGKGKVALLSVVMLLIGAVGGLFGWRAADFPLLSNEYKDKSEGFEIKVENLKREVSNLKIKIADGTVLSQEKIDELQQKYDQLTENIATSTEKLASVLDTLKSDQAQLRDIENDIEVKSGEYMSASEFLEDLMNETTITKAQHEGLKLENDRLRGMVGELETANERRQATLDTLSHNVELLIVQIQGGSPLAPPRFDHRTRLSKVEALLSKVSRAKWVTPQLMNEYTDLYLAELGISSSREYFFAKIPVHDKLGTVVLKWAECLMNGNWSVYFRTIDGSHIGSYENAGASGAPRYEFRENLPSNIQADIESQIAASRVDGYEDKIAVLQSKASIHDTRSKVQRRFSSLWN
jgi:uncharacterized membrane-anchored protein YhcB (DUF1043 family)